MPCKPTLSSSLFCPILRLNCSHSGIVIDQAVKGGFRFRNIDELNVEKEEDAGEAGKSEAQRSPREDSIEKDKSSNEFIGST
jgi:hypothetical protein